MTRHHCLLQLLRHGSLARIELVEITGWLAQEVDRSIEHALALGAIERMGASGEGRITPKAWCRGRYALSAHACRAMGVGN